MRIPWNENNQKYYYTCPYWGTFDGYVIPNCYTATALFIYYQIFYTDLSISITNTKLLPLWRYILWLKHRNLYVTNDFSKLMHFLINCPWTTLPEKGPGHHYTKKELFYAEARHFIVASHLWDWVCPHLRKTYPHLHIGELYDDFETINNTNRV